jgi:hypothetical protein
MTNSEIKTKKTFLGLERAEWWLWAKWVLVTIVGGVVGFFVGAFVGFGFQFMAIVHPALAIAVGAAQWLFLRKQGSLDILGILVDAAATGMVVGILMFAFATEFVGILVQVAGGAIVIRTIQWLFLRKHGLLPSWCILSVAVAVGTVVGVFVGTSVVDSVGDFVGGVVGAVAFGAITGLVVIKSPWHPKER